MLVLVFVACIIILPAFVVAGRCSNLEERRRENVKESC